MQITALKKHLSADSCEVEVRTARGNVYLYFVMTEEKGLWCVGRSSYYSTLPTVPKEEFLKARTLAALAMRAKALENLRKSAGQEETSMSDAEIVHFAIKDAKCYGISIETAVADFFKTRPAYDSRRQWSVMQEIGKIGGTASKKAAEQRRQAEKKEAEKARQGTLPF